MGAIDFMEQTNSAIYEYYLFMARQDVYSNVLKPSNWKQPSPYVPFYTENEINKFRTGEKVGTDWLREITRPGRIQDYNLTVSGKEKNISYYSSFNIYDQKGIIKDNDLSKYAATLNVDQKFGDKLTGGFDVKFSQQNIDNVLIGSGKRFEGGGILTSAVVFDPTLPVYDDQGRYHPNVRQGNIPNPAAYLDIDNKTRMERLLSTVHIDYEVIPSLILKGQAGIDRSQSENYNYVPNSHPHGAGYHGRADRSSSFNTNYQLQFLANYIRTFANKHNVSSTLGTEYMKYRYENMNVFASNFPFDGALWYNLGLATARPSIGSSGGSSELISYFLRLSYDYDFKYFITANFRVDGSSNFSPENQYAFFPGVSVAWDITRESFMVSTGGWLKQLKLRVGYGKTGNDNIGTAFSDWYSPGANTLWGTNITSGIRLAGIGNRSLTWEKQEDINFGIDFALFNNNAVIGNIDLYDRTVSQLLGSQDLPSWHPIGGINYNLESEKQSYGVEATLNTKNIKNPNFSWFSTITGTYYRDRWLKRDPSITLDIHESPKAFFGELWYRKSDGIVQFGETDPTNPVPGMIRIIDSDGYKLDSEGNRVVDENGRPMYSGQPDGKFDNADMQLIGVNVPFTIGFSNTLNYKQFDLSIFTYGVFNQ